MKTVNKRSLGQNDTAWSGQITHSLYSLSLFTLCNFVLSTRFHYLYPLFLSLLVLSIPCRKLFSLVLLITRIPWYYSYFLLHVITRTLYYPLLLHVLSSPCHYSHSLLPRHFSYSKLSAFSCTLYSLP